MAKADRRLADMPKFKDKSHLMSFPVHQSPGKNKNNIYYYNYYDSNYRHIS